MSADRENGAETSRITRLAPPALLIRTSEVTAVARGNGVISYPYVGAWNSDTAAVTTGVTVIPPGQGIPLHTHNVDETVIVLNGRARATVAELDFEVTIGDATWVPASVAHCFTNSGDDDLRIYWVYGGRSVTRTICATGETFDHLSSFDRVT